MKPYQTAFLLLYLLSFTLSAQTLTLGVQTVIAQQNYSTNPDESPVRVTGQVRKLPGSGASSNGSPPALMPTNFTVYGQQAGYDSSQLIPAANVTVRFWQPATPNIFFNAVTDENGHYEIGLSEGIWVGEACGSVHGYYPSAWSLQIDNNEIKVLQPLPQKNLKLDILTPGNAIRAGDAVTLSGSGFGCNGRLTFVYSNYVDIQGVVHDVDYGVENVEVDNFISRTDTSLRFSMPELGENSTVHKHLARIYYHQGNSRSNSLAIAQLKYEILPEDVINAADIIDQTDGQSSQTVAEILELTELAVILDGQQTGNGTSTPAATTAGSAATGIQADTPFNDIEINDFATEAFIQDSSTLGTNFNAGGIR